MKQVIIFKGESKCYGDSKEKVNLLPQEIWEGFTKEASWVLKDRVLSGSLKENSPGGKVGLAKTWRQANSWNIRVL